MDPITYSIVDVFAETKFAGNPLAVFRGPVPEALMLALAREMNYSEVTFITSETPRDGGYDVRIFTPTTEVPFAGHPTLGTAHVLRTLVAPQAPEQVLVNLKLGQIPVRFEPMLDAYWMQQKSPVFGQPLDPARLAAVLGLEAADLDARFPVEEVSTGSPFIIVPLRTLASLQRARVNREAYFELVAVTEAKAILIFCPETRNAENHLSVRVFAEYFGIPEDPATGSGNGSLAGYLAQHRYWGESGIAVRVEQGHQVNRPSVLHLRASETSNRSITVEVAGRVITVATGALAL